MDSYAKFDIDSSAGSADLDSEEEKKPSKKRWTKFLADNMGSWWIAQLTRGKKVPTWKSYGPWDFWAFNNPLPGTGVDIYIVDTGVRHNHAQFFQYKWTFSSRVRNFKDVKDDEKSPYSEGKMVIPKDPPKLASFRF